MALDEALMDRARRTGQRVLRVYGWSVPTLSLGRNQRARGFFTPERAHACGIQVVRRMTGGRALLHDHEVTYSVTAPVASEQTLRDSYAAVNRLLLRALQTLGVPATLAAPRERAPRPASAPCFERPTVGEIVVEGRKLVGSAQLRDHEAFLQHGSILIDDDQGQIERLATTPVGRAAPAATLRAVLGRAPEFAEVAAALVDALRALADPQATELVLDDATLAVQREGAARYGADSWTWRR